ncbi:PleD family two-component system response regulator [Spongisporangium articulatum]|uniref:PleD family two-component system response regulator n=1 Tax=Spongisporangium articulatum TaxID=3362603 RepID=A0ABW8ARE9_9ACTN
MTRVLVVDDDPDMVRIVTFRLRERGHRVIGAGSGTEALEIMQTKGAPDVVVADVSMPDMDGLELARRLRQTEALQSIPVIFLSARVTPEDIQAGHSLGALYLTKPFVASALLAKIDEATRTQVAESAW